MKTYVKSNRPRGYNRGYKGEDPLDGMKVLLYRCLALYQGINHNGSFIGMELGNFYSSFEEAYASPPVTAEAASHSVERYEIALEDGDTIEGLLKRMKKYPIVRGAESLDEWLKRVSHLKPKKLRPKKSRPYKWHWIVGTYKIPENCFSGGGTGGMGSSRKHATQRACDHFIETRMKLEPNSRLEVYKGNAMTAHRINIRRSVIAALARQKEKSQ